MPKPNSPGYVVVSFLEDEPPRFFLKGDWPLHVTIAPPFVFSRDFQKLVFLLEEVSVGLAPFRTVGIRRDLFGKNKDVPVTLVESVPSLVTLNRKFIGTASLWVEFRGIDHGGYRPHVSDQLCGRLDVGQSIILGSVSLVEMRRDERRIAHTLVF